MTETIRCAFVSVASGELFHVNTFLQERSKRCDYTCEQQKVLIRGTVVLQEMSNDLFSRYQMQAFNLNK